MCGLQKTQTHKSDERRSTTAVQILKTQQVADPLLLLWSSSPVSFTTIYCLAVRNRSVFVVKSFFFLSRVSLAVSVVPLHDFIVLLDLLLDVRQFALQVLAALLLLQERRVLVRWSRNIRGLFSHKTILLFYFDCSGAVT